MTIKEALERNKSPEGSIDLDPAVLRQRHIDKDAYEEVAFVKGTAILKDAGIPELLEELKQEINSKNPDSPDATMKIGHYTGHEYTDGTFSVGSNGTVDVSLKWNYKYSRNGTNYNQVTVRSYPLTGAIGVEGHGSTLISAEDLKTKEGKTKLEDAIVNAYNNPPVHTPPMVIG